MAQARIELATKDIAMLERLKAKKVFSAAHADMLIEKHKLDIAALESGATVDGISRQATSASPRNAPAQQSGTLSEDFIIMNTFQALASKNSIRAGQAALPTPQVNAPRTVAVTTSTTNATTDDSDQVVATSARSIQPTSRGLDNYTTEQPAKVGWGSAEQLAFARKEHDLMLSSSDKSPARKGGAIVKRQEAPSRGLVKSASTESTSIFGKPVSQKPAMTASQATPSGTKKAAAIREDSMSPQKHTNSTISPAVDESCMKSAVNNRGTSILDNKTKLADQLDQPVEEKYTQLQENNSILQTKMTALQKMFATLIDRVIDLETTMEIYKNMGKLDLKAPFVVKVEYPDKSVESVQTFGGMRINRLLERIMRKKEIDQIDNIESATLTYLGEPLGHLSMVAEHDILDDAMLFFGYKCSR